MKKILPLICLIAILFIAGFLRLYKIEDYMGFLGDEGRDALVVKRMIVDGKFTLLGPITSVGLMHLGPAYYYFMVPFLWLWGLNPVGPAIMVAIFSLATIVLIWKMAVEFFNYKVAFFASLFYALSPLVIIHAHSSWNPNILPFWSLLTIYSLAKVYIKKNYWYLLLAGATIGIAIQLHYIALILIPLSILGFFVFRTRPQMKFIILGITSFLAAYSPFIIFEIRHKFINTTTVLTFITRSGDAKTFGTQTVINLFWDLTVRLFWRLVVIESAELSILLLGLVIGICVYIAFVKNVKWKKPLFLLFFWYIAGLGMMSFYVGNIYDYYLTFVFPLPFLLTAVAFSFISQKIIGKIIVFFLVLGLVYLQIKTTPILKEPNRLAAQAREISDFILQKAQGEPYNFALLADKNSDHAYRYFLEIGNNSPVVIKNEVEDPVRTSVTDQLFLVCEEKVCQPLGHPLWEIAGFGRGDIAEEWNVGLFKVFKIVHYQGS